MPRRRPYDLSTPWTRFYAPKRDNDPWSNDFTIIQYGPGAVLRHEPEVEAGPHAFTLAHPELFDTGPTSEPEGWFYWALLQIRGDEGAEGGWYYQSKFRPAGRAGSATVDFVIVSPVRDIACRIQTRFHIEIGPEKVAFDNEQAVLLQDGGYDVIDAFDYLFMGDQSGLAVKRVAERVIAKDPALNPLSQTYLGGS
jgi:hypothetical protein